MYHGTESLSNLGPRTWNLVPDKIKQLVDIHGFKKGTTSGSQKTTHADIILYTKCWFYLIF